MSGPPEHLNEHFRPLRPAKGVRWITAIVLGPVVWLVALIATTVILDRTDAIEVGLLIAACSFVVGFVVLVLLRRGRNRERRRYERG